MLKICFVGQFREEVGSDRVFGLTINKLLNKSGKIKSECREKLYEEDVFDIIIFQKGTPLKTMIKIKRMNGRALLGIINPSSNQKKIFKYADFAIVGSIEEKAYYSEFIKCLLYPLIEDIDHSIYTQKKNIEAKTICYHGNKMHIDGMHINIKDALMKLVNQGYRFKAIYNIDGLGKSKEEFITEHVQWEKGNWLNQISSSTVGLCPASHYPGRLRMRIANYISRKNGFTNDILLRYKNNVNAGRSFIFHQLSVPVVAEISGSHQHIMGDDLAGRICYSKQSWYENIKRISEDSALAKQLAKKALSRFTELYNPNEWINLLIKEIDELVSKKMIE